MSFVLQFAPLPLEEEKKIPFELKIVRFFKQNFDGKAAKNERAKELLDPNLVARIYEIKIKRNERIKKFSFFILFLFSVARRKKKKGNSENVEKGSEKEEAKNSQKIISILMRERQGRERKREKREIFLLLLLFSVLPVQIEIENEMWNSQEATTAHIETANA